MGLFIFVSSSVQKLEPKNSIFLGLPKKIEFYDSISRENTIFCVNVCYMDFSKAKYCIVYERKNIFKNIYSNVLKTHEREWD
jgi:hypothetical protein